jgi:hypothetical protein
VSLSKDHPAHTHLLNICSSEDGSVVLMSLVFWTRSSMFWDFIIEEWLPLWSSGQSCWLQIQRSGFDSRRYQIHWEVVGLERVHLASWVQLRSYLKEKVAAPV